MSTLACKLNYDGGIDSSYPDGDKPQPGGSAQIHLAWDRPTTNADTSTYRNPNSHIILYGTSAGTYTQQIALSSDTDPGMLERVVDGLTDGQTYYFVVRSVNSEDTQSANSSEFSTTAAIPSDTEPTWTDITSLPYTISSSGNYRLASSLTIASGAGITISASNVRLYGGNGSWGDGTGTTLTYGTTGDSNAILFSGAYDDVRIHGFEFVKGASVPTGLNAGTCIYRLGTVGDNVEIDHCTFDLSGGNTVGIRFASHTGSNLRIHDNTVDIDGTGIAYFINEMTGSGGLKSYNNTISQTDTTGYVGPYYHVDNAEIYGDTFTFGGTGSQLQGFYCQSWGNHDNYFHGNTITVTSERIRPFNPDGGGYNWTILHNTITMHHITGGTNRCISMRYNSNNHSIGFNTIVNGTAGDNVGIRFGGRDGSGSPAPDLVYNCWCYHNDVEADVPLEFYGSGSSYDPSGQYFYSWGNSWDAGTGACISDSDVSGVDDVYFNGETYTTTGTKVVLVASHLSWDVCDAFVAGDVSGSTAHMTFNSTPCTYPSAEDKTPSAPTNLREL